MCCIYALGHVQSCNNKKCIFVYISILDIYATVFCQTCTILINNKDLFMVTLLFYFNNLWKKRFFFIQKVSLYANERASGSFMIAAEQKARTTYDNILRLVDDPDVRDPIKFLRAREVVHFQRFGEGLRIATDKLNSKNYYAFNPSFDKNATLK